MYINCIISTYRIVIICYVSKKLFRKLFARFCRTGLLRDVLLIQCAEKSGFLHLTIAMKSR